MLQTRELSIAIGARRIVSGLDLSVPHGEVVGLLGPNGCGKSTILRTVYRALRPTSGELVLDGADLLAMPMRASARVVAAVAQESGSEFDFTVSEAVMMGRSPHLGPHSRPSNQDHLICAEAMADADVLHLRDRGILGLSGGERQRVLIARALAQRPRLLVLDEPTNHLDLAHQLRILSLLRKASITVLVVLHDLNLAAAVCDRIHLVRDGSIVASGCPTDVITSELVRDVFDVDAIVVPHPMTGGPQVLHTLTQEKESR